MLIKNIKTTLEEFVSKMDLENTSNDIFNSVLEDAIEKILEPYDKREEDEGHSRYYEDMYDNTFNKLLVVTNKINKEILHKNLHTAILNTFKECGISSIEDYLYSDYIEHSSTFEQYINSMLIQHNISLKELATKSKISESRLNTLLKCKEPEKSISIFELNFLAIVLDVPIGELCNCFNKGEEE